MGGKARKRAHSLSSSLILLGQLDELARIGASRAELDTAFDALFLSYSALPETERQSLREAYNRCRSWGVHEFWWRHPSYLRRFKEEGHPRELRRALAHLSMSDGYPDMRDAILSLGDLVEAARTHGVPWRSAFDSMAPLSSLEDSGVGSLQALLSGFG